MDPEGMSREEIEAAKHQLWMHHLIALKHNEFKGFEPPPSPIPWDKFDKVEFPHLRWRIKNLVPMEGLVILASPSGEKKTWIAMEMARCIANGEHFLGIEKFAVQKGSVLYIDQEMSKTEIQRRGRLLGLNETTEPIYLLSRDELNLQKKEHIEWLYAFIAEHQIRLVIIDTFRAVAGDIDENSAREVREFFNKFKPLKDKGVTIVFLDHCKKPYQNEGKVPRKDQLFASQDKVASVEVLLMTRSDDRSQEIQVYQRKNRNGIECDPFRIEMIDEVNEQMETVRIRLAHAGEIDDRSYKLDQAKEVILTVLGEQERSRKEILSILLKIHNIGSKNTSVALRELASDNLLITAKKGREHIYSLANPQLMSVVNEAEIITAP